MIKTPELKTKFKKPTGILVRWAKKYSELQAVQLKHAIRFFPSSVTHHQDSRHGRLYKYSVVHWLDGIAGK